jgi:hypothetical protein
MNHARYLQISLWYRTPSYALLVRLTQTGGVDGAIQNVRDLQVHLENSKSGLTGTERRNALLRWLDDQARPAIEFLFEDGTDIIEEIDASCDRLAGSHLDGSDLYSLATRENTRWRERIRRVEEDLQRQKQFADRRGTPVVLDTSVLMEAEPLGTIDWPSPAPIRLIVPILVVEELDNLLHDRDAARRKKARDARRVLMAVHPGNKPTEPEPLPGMLPLITLEVLVDNDWRQRRANNDAEIVDQALDLHRITGLALLATCELQQYYRAGAVDLPAILVPRRDDQS